MVLLRPFLPGDAEAVRRIHETAFARSSEADMVFDLAASPAYVPGLSLVAEVDGSVVGHAMSTRIHVVGSDRTPCLALGPIAVDPAFQCQGIGSMLILHSHAVAKRLGEPCIVLLGSPDYYQRFGYRPAGPFGIRCPFEVPHDAWMVRWLALPTTLEGVVEYPEPWLAVD